jgi:ATP-dependent DNA helicase RecG
VEVGVDVPNASVMIIEGAERFGLAQLHQFRGRVGRANHQSYCLLFISPPRSDQAIDDSDITKRLKAFEKTQDGFELAELDLKLRGFGELFGSSQSGWNFKYFDPDYFGLIPAARSEAKKLLEKDPGLNNYPELKKEIETQTIHLE